MFIDRDSYRYELPESHLKAFDTMKATSLENQGDFTHIFFNYLIYQKIQDVMQPKDELCRIFLSSMYLLYQDDIFESLIESEPKKGKQKNKSSLKKKNKAIIKKKAEEDKLQEGEIE